MRRGRLLLKIYLGSVVTVLLAGGIFIAIFVSSRSAHRQEIAFLAGHFVGDLALRRNDPAALQLEASRLGAFSQVQTSLYDASGKLLGSTVTPPLPMPSPSDLLALRASDRVELGALMTAHAVRENGRLVAVGIVRHNGPRLEGFALPVGFVMLFLVAIAVFFARHLARPLERIAETARRFGQGDLAARSGVERKDEIGEVARAFDEMANSVTRLMTAQRELMANVSHELQTPLSRIHVAVDLLADGVSDQAMELLPEIAHDLGELERLIDDVMTVARLDLSRSREPGAATPLRRETVCAADLIEKAASRFRSQCQTHDLVIEVSAGLPTISGDAVLLRRVIENLLENARKYSDPHTTIEVSASAGASRLTVNVTDHGMGMDQADLERVFNPFFRGDASRSRSTGGVGLGLALARRVVEAHGGTIRIESSLSMGTTVTLDLPAWA
jgi:two-component system, OmpR family, sensor kinase